MPIKSDQAGDDGPRSYISRAEPPRLVPIHPVPRIPLRAPKPGDEAAYRDRQARSQSHAPQRFHPCRRYGPRRQASVLPYPILKREPKLAYPARASRRPQVDRRDRSERPWAFPMQRTRRVERRPGLCLANCPTLAEHPWHLADFSSLPIAEFVQHRSGVQRC